MKRSSPPKVHWVRSNGFILGMALAVLLAFLFPGPGSRHGFLHPDVVTNVGIALILFLQGLSLAFEQVKSGAGNWRLHCIIQSFTFVVFPLAGLLIHFLLPLVWPDSPLGIRQGFLYLCVLPSTISTSVVLTAAAGGNTPGALFNAALSNIAGVVLTPVFVHLLMESNGGSGSMGSMLGRILLLTLVPFALGMMLRPLVKNWADAHKKWFTRISNGVILFIVYSAFCDSIEEKIWNQYGFSITGKVMLGAMLLFGTMSLLVFGTVRLFKLNRGDSIAAYFCSVKKTLAMGVPLAMLIFGDKSDLSLILLPVMFYHPVQLLCNGILANHLARQREH